jgi:hypothetical protein
MAEDVLGIREIQVYLYRERDAAKVRLKSEVGRIRTSGLGLDNGTMPTPTFISFSNPAFVQ